MNKDLLSLLDEYKKFNEVKSIAIGGSCSAGTSDNKSDIDVYIFVECDIPVEKRLEIIKGCSSKYEAGGQYFGAGDEYFVDKLGRQLDIMYWNTIWFKSVFENIWKKCYPANGYTTCFLYTLKNLDIIYDTNGWLKKLQDGLNQGYPKKLKENIIKRNLMLLKDKPFASYYEQISKAIERDDIVSINHRIAAFLASYFDIIFAKNELLHPGEKRLIKYAKENCKIMPEHFEEDITELLKQPNSKTLDILDKLVNNIKKM